MKLCYQVATPDVAIAPSVTAYQGPLEKSFRDLAALGYDGVEFMTINPDKLSVREIKDLCSEYGMVVALVCTGEVFGQLHVSFTDPDPGKRRLALEKVKQLTDFASALNAKLNIGRVRGCYYPGVVSKEKTDEWLIESLTELSDYAAERNVAVAIETVTILQINLLNTLEEAKYIVDKVGRSNLRIMMDTFHLNIEERDICTAIRDYANYNIHVHLCDNNRRYPGNCSMDFSKIITAFHDVGYDGCFSTEIMQIPDMHEAAKRSMEYLAPIFKEVYGREMKHI